MRCDEASKAWFQVDKNPEEGALIVFEKSQKRSFYGHVGRVIFYNSDGNWAVVRDMNYTKRYEMTDRWQNINEPEIKCYIHLPQTVETKYEPDPVINRPVPADVIVEELPILEQEIEEVANRELVEKNIDLVFENIDSQSEHFLSQRDIQAKVKIPNNGIMKVGEETDLILSFVNKHNENKFSGILPIGFSLLTTNDVIGTNYSSVKFVNNGEIIISVKMNKVGQWSVIINMGMQKIGKISFNVE